MSRLEKYMKTVDFLISEIAPESFLIQNLNKKYFNDIKRKKKILFMEVEDMEIELNKKNDIVYYPYSIRLKPLKSNTIRLPVFIDSPQILQNLLKHNKIKFKNIQIKNIQDDLSEKEKIYFYQEELFFEKFFRQINKINNQNKNNYSF